MTSSEVSGPSEGGPPSKGSWNEELIAREADNCEE